MPGQEPNTFSFITHWENYTGLSRKIILLITVIKSSELFSLLYKPIRSFWMFYVLFVFFWVNASSISVLHDYFASYFHRLLLVIYCAILLQCCRNIPQIKETTKCQVSFIFQVLVTHCLHYISYTLSEWLIFKCINNNSLTWADLNPVGVVGVFGEVGAACMTGRDILDAIRATHRVEGTGRTGAVGVTRGRRSAENRQRVRQTPAQSKCLSSMRLLLT